MNWNKIITRNDMPFDRDFLALWKGRICLASYDEEENRFWISWSPSEMNCMPIDPDREGKFTHWMELPKEPIYPDEY